LELKENVGSDRSWVWNCPADYAETTPTEEIFAIRFANTESKRLIDYQNSNKKFQMPNYSKKNSKSVKKK
jgi:hypothetical protein